MHRITSIHIVALLTLGCVKDDLSADELGEGESTETDDDAGSAADEGIDDEAGTEGDPETDGTTGEDDCPIGEYDTRPYAPKIDWSNASGSISHVVSHAAVDPSQWVDAVFYTTAYTDDSLLCMESIVEPAGVDSCWVWYTQGQGIGGDPLDNWFEDIAVDMASFDIGDGPVVLEATPATEFSPTWYYAALPPPPDGAPYGEISTLAATFEDLPDLDLDIEVPNELLPLGVALDVETLDSEGLASWTWSTPGGAEPIELVVTLGATPAGTGWSEWVEIRCEVSDDGAFAFPTEYLDLARERLGPEIFASARISRSTVGSVPLAGKDLHWQSSVEAWLSVAVID